MKHENLAFTGKTQLICILFICLIIICNLAEAKDWATYQHDNHRSGVTSERLDLPLSQQWSYISKHAPQQAWSAPAKQDFWHNRYGLRAKVRYDQTFHVVAVGDSMYFGSSANDKVYCLDISTGQERWSFFTGGPVRLAPTVWDNKVYFGSDDGYVYCLKAEDGELVWKYRASPSSRMIPGNSRMISAWPVRSGVIIKDDVAYFGAGLFPKENVYLCALDARDGTVAMERDGHNAPSRIPPGFRYPSLCACRKNRPGSIQPRGWKTPGQPQFSWRRRRDLRPSNG